MDPETPPAAPVLATPGEIIFNQNFDDGTPAFREGQLTWAYATQVFPFVLIACGRRRGKTTFVKLNMLARMAKHKGGFYQGAYMAQSHNRASRMYEEIRLACEGAGMVKRCRDKGQDRWIEFNALNENHGGIINFWSGEADAHEGAHGEGLDDAWLDEASLVPEAAFTSTLLPMLADKGGHMIVLGSPFPEGLGFAWFEKLWTMGDPGNPDRDPSFMSFNAPTEANPNLKDPSWPAVQRRLCRNREEELCLYDGKFARDMGAVFSNLKACFCLTPIEPRPGFWMLREPRPGERTVAGLDLGKHKDATVLVVFSLVTFEMLCCLKIDQTDYFKQLPQIDWVWQRFGKPILYADARDGGNMLIEDLSRRYGDRAVPVKWTMGGKWDKATSVVKGQDLFQRATWKLLDLKWLKEEFRLYSKKQLPAGGWKYDAPAGSHDDGVTACLYASYGIPIEALTVAQETKGPAPGTYDAFRALRDSQQLDSPTGSPFHLRSR